MNRRGLFALLGGAVAAGVAGKAVGAVPAVSVAPGFRGGPVVSAAGIVGERGGEMVMPSRMFAVAGDGLGPTVRRVFTDEELFDPRKHDFQAWRESIREATGPGSTLVAPAIYFDAT